MPEQALDKAFEVVVVGSGGQLDQCLQAAQPGGLSVAYIDRSGIDLTDFSSEGQLLAQMQPQVIINATAYTSVDKAEIEIDLAFQVNVMEVEHLSAACANFGMVLAHPLGVYSVSKLVGEQGNLATANLKASIVRASCLVALQ
jgi:dTDP-4-dehydrorhamnose reductase